MRFRSIVYGYYKGHRRAMPWRETRDPYRILVSEVMLQQTQVSRVLGKYSLFIRRFPTIQRLARAPLADILRAWQGLGYNRRALALKRLAEEVVARYRGRLPASRDELRSLPGIGEATSGAILAFAFNTPVIFIETNIRSVYIHHFFRGRAAVTDEELVPYIDKTLDRKNPRDWYYALMDYGVYLKSIHLNPARTSGHYRRQPPFKGSDREVRGKVLKLLTAKRRIGKLALQRMLGTSPARLDTILSGLTKDGLIKRSGSAIAL